MFHIKVVEKIKTHIYIQFFFRKSCRLREKVEKYCTDRQDTDKNVIWRLRIACWIPKATNTHSQYVILIAFPLQQWL